jgi:hypothetical protein
MPKQPTSPEFSITKAELAAVGRGLLVAVGGAVLTYLTVWITGTSFNVTIDGNVINLTPFVVAAWSVVVNFARKYIPENK